MVDRVDLRGGPDEPSGTRELLLEDGVEVAVVGQVAQTTCRALPASGGPAGSGSQTDL